VTVLCVGIATRDNLILVEKYPDKDERVIALEISIGYGGPAATAAVTLARLGISVALAAVVGDDEDGRGIIQNLQKEGVDTTLVTVDPSIRTASATIIISKTEDTRAIIVRLAPLARLSISKSLSQDFEWIHCDQQGVHAVKEAGVIRGALLKLSIDLGYWVPGVRAEEFDLFAPSDRVMQDLFPDMDLSESVSLLAKGSTTKVVVPHGAKGAYYADTECHGLASAESNQVLSTLGAGDVFHGALLATQIWGTPLNVGTAIANLIAGISCQALDGQSGVPRKAELLVELAKRGISV
jgi:sulfofructose kinase